MSPEDRAKQIESATLRAARKALQRHPDSPVTRDELLRLKVQSVPSWQRWLLIAVGLAMIVAGGFIDAADGSVFGAVALLVLGLAFFIFGIVGRRRTVETMLESLGNGLAEIVVQGVIAALD